LNLRPSASTATCKLDSLQRCCCLCDLWGVYTNSDFCVLSQMRPATKIGLIQLFVKSHSATWRENHCSGKQTFKLVASTADHKTPQTKDLLVERAEAGSFSWKCASKLQIFTSTR
jgi:hypothetical protein